VESAATARAAIDRLAAARPSVTLGEHPPVLVLPRLPSPADCAALIEVWHRPVTRWQSDGLRTDGFAIEEGAFKIRVDTYGKLNAGDYEGGRLRFPEYGDHGYEVERGTGIVWSRSPLHEVDPVTRGRRFILGTHFFNDLAAMQAATAAGRR